MKTDVLTKVRISCKSSVCGYHASLLCASHTTFVSASHARLLCAPHASPLCNYASHLMLGPGTRAQVQLSQQVTQVQLSHLMLRNPGSDPGSDFALESGSDPGSESGSDSGSDWLL